MRTADGHAALVLLRPLQAVLWVAAAEARMRRRALEVQWSAVHADTDVVSLMSGV